MIQRNCISPWGLAIAAAAVLSSWSGCNSTGSSGTAPSPSTPSPLAAARLDAQKHLSAGKQDAAAGDYRGAVEEFTLALNGLQPAEGPIDDAHEDVELLYQRGLAWLELGFPDTAAVDFSEVLRLDHRDGAAFAKRGQAYVALGDLYRAVRDSTEAIRLDPKNAAAYRYRGLAYLGRGQFERATVDLEQAIDLDPTIEPQTVPLLGKAYFGWSQRLESAGERSEAAAKLARATELNPTYVAAAVVEPAGEPATPVMASARTAAKPVIDDAVEHYSRACDLQSRLQFDEAIMEFTEAIALDRSYVDAYVRRAETLMAAGFPDSALKDLSEVIRIDERSASAYRLQAQAFTSLGSYHRAALSATEALHNDPGDALMYALRGKAYLHLDDPERARADLEEAVRRSPDLEGELRPFLDEAHTQLEN